MIENIIHQLPLPLLERQGQHWNFRCVVCGDSKKSETKKRGWILVDGNKITYHCHNCGYSKPIIAFLKQFYPDVHKAYVKLRFKQRRDSSKIVQTAPKKEEPTDLPSRLDLPTLNRLPNDHEAVQYFHNRKFPTKFLRYFYWADNFKEFTNTHLPGKFEDTSGGDPRIVIPFYNRHRKIFIFQGRSLEPHGLRYITIKIDDGYHKKVFGLERMKPNKTVLVVEGAFDSLFLPNAIAMGGADLNYGFLEEQAPKEKYIFCFDNEPRNKEMCYRVEKTLEQGFRVCLMPHNLKSRGKDINDLILSGMTAREICAIIKDNIHQGKFGLMRFNLWKKGK